jgi:hypothetical protein
MNTQITPQFSAKEALKYKESQLISYQLGKRVVRQQLIFVGFHPHSNLATFERITPIVSEFFKYNKQQVMIGKESREVKTVSIPIKNIKDVK